MGLEIITTNKRVMSCDNPKCDTVIQWIEEEVKEKEDLLPREYFRFLFVGRSYVDPDKRGKDPGQYTFCSGYCNIKYMENVYKPSTPPLLSTELQAACDEAVKNFEKERDQGTGQDTVPEPEESYRSNVIQMPSVAVPALEPVRKTDEPVDGSPSDVEPA